MTTYMAHINECIDAHMEHNDDKGANAIRAMSELPRNKHRAYARKRGGYPRDCCMNAILYAEQFA